MKTKRLPFSIAVIGDINADLSFRLPTFPREGDDTAVTALRWGSGGGGLNMAVALARLGARSYLVGRVGADLAADVALYVARQSEVDLSFLQADRDVPTGLCGVMVSPSGQRSFLSFRGANVGCDPALIGRSMLSGQALLLVSSYALLDPPQQLAALHAIDIAVGLGIPCALDLCLPAIRLARDLVMATIPKLRLLTLNEDELHTLLPGQGLQQGCDTLIASGAQAVVVKRGAQGCSVADPTTWINIYPSVPVVAIDTNGCGDAFTAGFVWALLHGCDLADCAELANLMGALTATQPGAANAIPTREALDLCLDPRIAAKLADL
ncbi:MAG: carbohydrate kinase family protein [Oscillochloris sp.]|nr:carbohydrate kinase family protein [Oscillochloris sp.]